MKEEKARTETRLVNRPKNISKETIFVRELYASFWRNEFGSPLYNTFATFSNVVFGYANGSPSALTAAKVRKALN